ncbi:hypothetical protein ARMGADRAFT_1084990 [Armillaria gallica]|uniref:Uncharacterized protein n=1 Tax=Armillaria gallica TaxID=47427 RepID=A0A2H3DIE0_ARMGA|nr:hypothetical protein ARMGADRAFT_1084990 [Armillaria gallica]
MGVDAYIGINDFDQTAWDALLTFLPPSLFLSAYEDYVHRTSPQIIATSGHCQVKTHAPLMHAPSPQCHQVEFKDKRSSKTCILSRQWDISSSTRDVPRCCITVRRASLKSPSAKLSICIRPCALASSLGSEYGDRRLENCFKTTYCHPASNPKLRSTYLAALLGFECMYLHQMINAERSLIRLCLYVSPSALAICIAVRQPKSHLLWLGDSEIKITRDNRSPSDEQYQAMGGLALTICIAVWRASCGNQNHAELPRDDVSPSNEEHETMAC